MEIDCPPRRLPPANNARCVRRLSGIALCCVVLASCTLFDSNRVRSWHAFRSSGQAALLKDDYSGARISFQAALHEVSSLPNETLRVAVSLKDLSSICANLKDTKLAEKVADKAVASIEKSRQLTSPEQTTFAQNELGQALNNIGDFYLKQVRDFEKAATLYAKAEILFEDIIKRHSNDAPNCFAGYHLAKSLLGLGQSLSASKNQREAANIYSKAASPEFFNSIPEVTRRQLVAAYAELPQIPDAQKAEFAAKLGMVSSEQQPPGDLSYQHLLRGRALLRSGQLPAAQAEFLKAWSMARVLPQPSAQMADTLLNLGMCYIKQEQFADAESVLLKALPMYEKVKTDDPKDLNYCLFTLGTLYLRMGNPTQAEPYALRRRAIWLESVGPAASETIQSNIFLGEVYFQSKKLDKSYKYYHEAEEQLLKSKRVERRLLARAYTGEAAILLQKSDLPAAKALLEKALDIWRTHGETDPRSSAFTEALYAQVNQRLGISSNTDPSPTSTSASPEP